MPHPYDADKWEEVSSSHIEAIGTKGSWLLAKFKKTGQVYRYVGFAYLFEDLLAAPSVGKLFHEEVKSVTDGERIGEDWPNDGD